MLITRAEFRGHENLLPEVRHYARASIQLFHTHRRFLRFVDTHQKWLLIHLIASTCAQSQDGRIGVPANRICDRAAELDIASRNTSLAFFDQLAGYGYVIKRDCELDRRVRRISLSDSALLVMHDWTRTMIAASTGRPADHVPTEELHRIYLDLAAILLADAKWMNPPLDVMLTQNMRGGWLAMGAVLRQIPEMATGEAWVPLPGLGITALTHEFGLTRSTLYRLVRLSVEAGTMTWQEQANASTLCVNLYHLRQFSRWIVRALEATADAHARQMSDRHVADGAAA